MAAANTLGTAAGRTGPASAEALLAKWGDCFAGCIYEHHWEVLVPHDARLPAELVGEGGDPLPPL